LGQTCRLKCERSPVHAGLLFWLASPQAGDAPLEGLIDLLMQLLARFAYDLIKWVVNKLREWWRQKT
jgi:hypothetical protein